MIQYRRLAGVINWAVPVAVPVGCYAASYMQQKLGKASVKHICSANGMLVEILKLKHVVLFKCPQLPLAQAFIGFFFDASFNISRERSYGQNGFVTIIVYQQEESATLEYHVVGWEYVTPRTARKSLLPRMQMTVRSTFISRFGHCLVRTRLILVSCTLATKPSKFDGQKLSVPLE